MAEENGHEKTLKRDSERKEEHSLKVSYLYVPSKCIFSKKAHRGRTYYSANARRHDDIKQLYIASQKMITEDDVGQREHGQSIKRMFDNGS